MNTFNNQPFKPELLVSAGNFVSFFAALEAGADAVYVRLKKFSAKKLEELSRIITYAQKREQAFCFTKQFNLSWRNPRDDRNATHHTRGCP